MADLGGVLFRTPSRAVGLKLTILDISPIDAATPPVESETRSRRCGMLCKRQPHWRAAPSQTVQHRRTAGYLKACTQTDCGFG
jgi:hypothetical protein